MFKPFFPHLSFSFLSLIFSLLIGKALPKHWCLLSWGKTPWHFRSPLPFQSLLQFLFILYALNVSLLPLCQVPLNFLSDHLSLDHLLSTEIASTKHGNTFLENLEPFPFPFSFTSLLPLILLCPQSLKSVCVWAFKIHLIFPSTCLLAGPSPPISHSWSTRLFK